MENRNPHDSFIFYLKNCMTHMSFQVLVASSMMNVFLDCAPCSRSRVDISEVLTAPIITLMMEAGSTS
jgi:hypothetical protein